MPNIINTQTNRKEIEIQRDGEKVGSIYFDPSDVSIIKRLREAQAKLSKLDTGDKLTAGKDIDKMLEKADEIDKELRDAIDYAFDYPCSDIVFGAGYSFTTHKGVSAVEQFLSGAIGIVQKEMNAEAKAALKRQDKYLAKYKNE